MCCRIGVQDVFAFRGREVLTFQELFFWNVCENKDSFFRCAGENLVLMLFFPIFLWHSFVIKNRQMILFMVRHFCNESNSCANPRATAHKFLKPLLGLLWIKFGYIYGSSVSFWSFQTALEVDVEISSESSGRKPELLASRSWTFPPVQLPPVFVNYCFYTYETKMI